jgi:hypothetical protein
MVLTQKQTGRPMRQMEEPDISPSITSRSLKKESKTHNGERQPLQQMLLGKLDIHM